MATIINAISTGVGGLIQTGDASGVLELQTHGVARTSISSVGLIINRIDSTIEGGQLTLNRSIDDVPSWAFDVYGSTSTPAFRFVDVTAGAERVNIDGLGNFAFNSGYGSAAIAYGCRAWVNFNGTGTVAIRASGNVSSITDNGVGDYTINFATAMPDVNYSLNLSGANTSTTAVYQGGVMTSNTGNVRFRTVSKNVAISDAPNFGDNAVVCVSVFR